MVYLIIDHVRIDIYPQNHCVIKNGIKYKPWASLDKIFQEWLSTPSLQFANEFVWAPSNSYALKTFQWNQHFPIRYVDSGVFTLISIVEIFSMFLGFVNISSRFFLCKVPHLSRVYWLPGCFREVRPRQPLLIDLVHTETLSSPCGHVVETGEWRAIGRDPDGHVWRHRDGISTPGSHNFPVAFRLIVPHLEAFSGYMQSVPELCVSVSEHNMSPYQRGV